MRIILIRITCLVFVFNATHTIANSTTNNERAKEIKSSLIQNNKQSINSNVFNNYSQHIHYVNEIILHLISDMIKFNSHNFSQNIHTVKINLFTKGPIWGYLKKLKNHSKVKIL